MPEKGESKKPIGLSPEDHGFLNGVHRQSAVEQREIYAQKRVQYAGNKIALEQIDVYDGTTFYHTQLKRFTEAIRLGDAQAEAKLTAWFEQNYPDIGKSPKN